ncbi:MAG: DUF4097 family beta strand repeat protein [Deltaproteobacteria bacterium]|nr:DUF4097 family beta strand repeat protein [Deltaproteobacteria bacterium]
MKKFMMRHIGYISCFVFTITGTMACTEHNLSHHEKIDASVSKLSLDVDMANVNVIVSDRDEAAVDIDISYRGSVPAYTIDTRNEKLSVSLDCPMYCSGDITLRVPVDTSVDVALDSGNAEVKGVEGDVSVWVESGDVAVHDLAGELDLRANNGSIQGRVQSKVCYADANDGNISLQFDRVPKMIDVVTRLGDIDLKVPSDSYRIWTQQKGTPAKIENIQKNNDSSNEIFAECGSGFLRIMGI